LAFTVCIIIFLNIILQHDDGNSIMASLILVNGTVFVLKYF